MRVLLVEDERKLSAMLKRGLGEEGHEVVSVASAEAAFVVLEERRFDVCVLDVGLPGIDGFCALERLRKEKHDVLVLILTARDAVADRVKGLRLGADDYLAKPFAFSELLARLGALYRRATPRLSESIQVGNLKIDPGRHWCEVDGAVLTLSAREFALMLLLARNSSGVVTRSMILSEIFGYNFTPSTNIVEVHVFHLRSKLAEARATAGIVTVRGVGYRLDQLA